MSKVIILDFETFYEDKKTGYSLSNPNLSTVEYIKDARFNVLGVCIKGLGHNEKAVYIETPTADDLRQVIPLDATIVAHHAKFDGAVLEWHYKIPIFRYVCTKALANAVLGLAIPSSSLRAVADYYKLEAKGYNPSANKGFDQLTPQEEKLLEEYCIHDIELCEQIFMRLIANFPHAELQLIDWTIKAFLRPALALDVPLLQQINVQENERRMKLIEKMGITLKDLASNVKFAALLASLGYEVPTKPSPKDAKKFIPALSKSDIGFINLLESEDQRLSDLCQARLAAKSCLLETRTKRLINVGKTGLWPFDLTYSGAKQTHRFSGGSAAGSNPQNFHSKGQLREAICAAPGFRLGVFDFSQVELRIQAYLANEIKLINVFEHELDPYCEFATSFYKRPITKADKAERQFGKEAMLALGYGTGWSTFQRRVRLVTKQNLTEEQAKAAVYHYRDYYTHITRFWDLCDNGLSNMHSSKVGAIHPLLKCAYQGITLPSGLVIKYPQLTYIDEEFTYYAYKGNSKTLVPQRIYGSKVFENVCQALAGEICKIAIARLLNLGYNVIGQVHDEVLFVVPDDTCNYKRISRHVQLAAENPPDWWPDIKLKAELGFGHTWAEAKQTMKDTKLWTK